jgi:hypothetical protein
MESEEELGVLSRVFEAKRSRSSQLPPGVSNHDMIGQLLNLLTWVNVCLRRPLPPGTVAEGYGTLRKSGNSIAELTVVLRCLSQTCHKFRDVRHDENEAR